MQHSQINENIQNFQFSFELLENYLKDQLEDNEYNLDLLHQELADSNKIFKEIYNQNYILNVHKIEDN